MKFSLVAQLRLQLQSSPTKDGQQELNPTYGDPLVISGSHPAALGAVAPRCSQSGRDENTSANQHSWFKL